MTELSDAALAKTARRWTISTKPVSCPFGFHKTPKIAWISLGIKEKMREERSSFIAMMLFYLHSTRQKRTKKAEMYWQPTSPGHCQRKGETKLKLHIVCFEIRNNNQKSYNETTHSSSFSPQKPYRFRCLAIDVFLTSLTFSLKRRLWRQRSRKTNRHIWASFFIFSLCSINCS